MGMMGGQGMSGGMGMGAGAGAGGFDPSAMMMMYQNMMKNSGMGESNFLYFVCSTAHRHRRDEHGGRDRSDRHGCNVPEHDEE